jgi:hypothetical protein
MKSILLAIMICISGNTLNAAVAPSVPVTEKNPLNAHRPTLKDVKRVTGRKLTLKQKLQFILLQYRMKKLPRRVSGKQNTQATLSMILGILSIVLLLTPLGIIAIPAAITGLVLGLISLKGNSNTKSIVGVITSSVTLLLILIAIILVAGFYY